MSKLAVANIIFETTEANRIEYTGNNVVRVRANGGLQIPFGTTAQRVPPEYGIIRYNTDLQTVEMYDAGGWYNMPTGGYVNSIYTVANSAYAAANNVGPQIAPTFNTANAAFGQANLGYTSSNVVYAAVNSAFGTINASYATVNADYAFTNSAYASINSNWTVTNTVYGVANAAFASANNVAPQVTPAYNTANAAFAAANTKFSSSGGTISGAVEITADLTVHGNTRFIDQQTLSVGDPLIYLAANNYTSDVVDIGFVANYVNATSSNVHTGLFRSSGTKEYYLFQGYDREPAGNYIDPTGNNITMAVLNSTVRTSNLILGGANAINWIGSAYASINSNWTVGNTAYTVANLAYGVANTALQNTTGTFAGTLTTTGAIKASSIGMFYTQGSSNLTSLSTNAFIIGTNNKAIAPSGGTGTIQINSDDAAASALQGTISLITDPTAANRRLAIGCIEQGTAWRNITLAETAGNVGIGTSSPSVSLDVGSKTDAIRVPVGTTAQRPTGAVGMIRFNTSTDALENYTANSGWTKVSVPVPTLSSISGTIYNGYTSTLTLSGSNFGSSANVTFKVSGSTVATSTVTPSGVGTTISVSVPSAVYGQSISTTVNITVTNNDGAISPGIDKTVSAMPSGGTITTSGNYRIHAFYSSSSFVNTISSLAVDYMIIAGGGGGGVLPGGGGAGGYLAGSTTLSATTYTATVGGGGVGGAGGVTGGNGSNSSCLGLTAIGGGGGGSHSGGGTSTSGASGGSGGGGSDNNNSYGPGSGTAGQGYAGGNGCPTYGTDPRRGGGGGGAGAVGGAYNTGGHGGDGVQNSILGTSYWWAGGGGAGMYSGTGSGGNGGKGGGGGGTIGTNASGSGGIGDTNGINAGGNGTKADNALGGSGGQNTGGGSGCNSWSIDARGTAQGGSGIVVIRYLVNNL